MNTEFSQEFKDFLKDYPTIAESEHYSCWIAYQAGKLKGQIEKTEERIKQLESETQQLRDSINSTHLNLPSKQDALPDNLLGCDGRKFRCKIMGYRCEGVVSVESGNVFLCQNVRDGGYTRDKKGYKYSWSVYKGRQKDFVENSIAVTEFELLD